MKVLITGGAGYIGSHTSLELLLTDHEVVVVDNFVNSRFESLRRVEELADKKVEFHQLDLRDYAALSSVFKGANIDAVIHFAGLKAVGESVSMPLAYYHNNLTATVVLAQVMQEFSVHNIVFSSSATVYGDPHTVPITEDFPVGGITNPYGRTKLMIEEILTDLQKAEPSWSVALLRYFNPVGAHESGRIGEDPQGIPNNLMPFVSQVAVGKLPELAVYGNDYPTLDGTGVRDYIHVVDLARGHLAALDALVGRPGVHTYNLGTGQGYSVLEMVTAFAEVSGRPVPYRITDRRPGDIATCYADPSKAARDLNWRAEMDLAAMCADTWRWQQANPDGFSS